MNYTIYGLFGIKTGIMNSWVLTADMAHQICGEDEQVVELNGKVHEQTIVGNGERLPLPLEYDGQEIRRDASGIVATYSSTPTHDSTDNKEHGE